MDLYGANRILYFALKAFPSSAKVEIVFPKLSGPLIDLLKRDFPTVQLRKYENIPIVQRKLFSIKGVGILTNQLLSFNSFLKKENKEEKIDLLYVNTLSNFFVLPIANFLKIPVLTHVHEILEHPKLIAVLFSRYACFFSDHILAVSDAVRQGLMRWSRKKDFTKIAVIHNGIEDMWDSKHTPEGDSKVIITLIARIKPEKGIWYFLDALQLLKNPELVHARIIGGPAPFGEHHVDKLIADIGKSNVETEYIPFTPDVSKFVNETDVLVVPSLAKESFPTTVLEGMSCAKAVIATRTGGAVEAIQDNVTGFLIEPDDLPGFAHKLEILVSDEDLRNRLGLSARQSFINNFTIDIYRDKLSNYFSTLPYLTSLP